MQRNILSGNADANNGLHSVNEVTAPPKEFTSWVKDNQERIARAKSLPYFLRDNGVIKDGEWVYGGSKVVPVATMMTAPVSISSLSLKDAQDYASKFYSGENCWKPYRKSVGT